MYTIGHIYTLTNPLNGDVFYIGQTTDPEGRKKTHQSRSNINNLNSTAAKYCKRHGIVPQFDIVETVYINTSPAKIKTTNILLILEEMYIHFFKSWGFSIQNNIRQKTSRYNTSILDYPTVRSDMKYYVTYIAH